jgi:hypothetical protein
LKNRITLTFVTLMIVSALVWSNSFIDVAASAENRIAIIEDVNGDRIGVEPTSDEVWNRLVELYHTREKMWIGGVVEVFIFIRPDPNYPWGFRFKPETVVVAEITAEGLQTTIRDICENLDYWRQLGHAYVFAKVIDYSVYSDLNDDRTVNILDIAIAAKAYGSREGDQNWNEFADLDRNAMVNILDISMVAKDYGETVEFST